MTRDEVITSADILYPNSYDRQDKERWIQDVERKIELEIINTHEDPISKNKEELYVGKPYSDMYIHYIMAQIDKYNEEYDRYSNHMALFNEDYSEFENQYHRTHMPIQHGTFSV